jgi:hypothetical protein
MNSTKMPESIEKEETSLQTQTFFELLVLTEMALLSNSQGGLGLNTYQCGPRSVLKSHRRSRFRHRPRFACKA